MNSEHAHLGGPTEKEMMELVRRTMKSRRLNFWQWQASTQTVEIPNVEADRAVLLRDRLLALIDEWNLSQEEWIDFQRVEITCQGGRKEYFALSAILFKDASGALSRVNGVAWDVTPLLTEQEEVETNPDFLNTLLDALASPVFYKDTQLVYRHCNRAFETYLGLPREQILNKSVHDLAPKALAEVYHQADQELLDSRGSQQYESQVKAADGSLRNVIFHKSVVVNRQGDIAGLIGIINDITERVQAEHKVKRFLQIRDAIAEVNRAVMEVETLDDLYEIALNEILKTISSADVGSILTVNAAGDLEMAASTGNFETAYESLELKQCITYLAMEGKPGRSFFINDLQAFSETVGQPVPAFFSDNGIQSLLCAPVIRHDQLQALIFIESRTPEVFDDLDISLMNYVQVHIAQSISKQMLYEENSYLARQDGLTGLFNRRCFNELFEGARKRAQRYNETLQLVLIDLDKFKKINDQFGHQAGDAVLRDFARRLKSSVRESDLVARFGGDEFILVLSNISAGSVRAKLQTLRRSLLETPLKLPDRTLPYSFSYGVAEFPTAGSELDQLFRLADDYMYADKHNALEKPAIESNG